MSPTAAILVSLAVVLANAFFVAAEFAFVKIRPTRIEQLANQGHRRARLLMGMLKRLNVYLSASQIGITVASLTLGWLGEPAVAKLLSPVMLDRWDLPPATVHTAATAISLTAITFLHTVVGELVPKALALQRTESVALWTAVPFQIFYLVTWPFTWALNNSANLVLKILRLPPPTEAEMVHSPDELRLVLQHVQLDPGPRRLIDRVFDYTHRVARHVMILRRDVVVLIAGRPFDDNLRIALSNQYTRYPLCDPDTDRVVGYVHLKDIVTALASGPRPEFMREIAREPIYASEETSLEWLRREFQRRRVHIAIILGPGHAFTGIVTLEDLLEEFVGEIQDEQDQEEIPPFTRTADGGFDADGRLTLDVAKRELGLKLPPLPADIETLGGFVLTLLADVPVPGDTVSAAGFQFSVLEVRDHRIRRLRGEPLPEPPPDEEEDGPRRSSGNRPVV
jgi:CBS domain containing-hemolysin-like protein